MNKNNTQKFVKIFGAGSIGNHLANAALYLGFHVDIFDNDKNALIRMKEDIFPSRYGKWNNNIKLYHLDENVNNQYDLICIGTPPDSHLDLLFLALKTSDCPILVEKPLCEPTLEALKRLNSLSLENVKRIYVGYNHVVSKSSNLIKKIIKENDFGKILSLDVEFRENWKGIFDAHHWLSGPEESYLGHTKRGGGSSGEHSHALNLWQHLCREFNLGKTETVISKYEFIQTKSVNYDSKSYFLLETDLKFKGTVTQDVLTFPSSKKIKIQGENFYLEWICNDSDNNDKIVLINKSNDKKEYIIEKNRPDDFIIELQHIIEYNKQKKISPINIIHGIETMQTLIAALESANMNKSIRISSHMV